MNKILDSIRECALDIAFPKHCIFCNKLIPAGEKICICNNCSDKTLWLRTVVIDDKSGCEEVMCPLKYEGNVRESMLKFKFKSIKYLGFTFAKEMAAMLDERKFFNNEVIITAVPIHGIRDRAYNQSEVLARVICELTGTDYCGNLLYKIKPIERISGMGYNDKKFFSKNAFHINSRYNL